MVIKAWSKVKEELACLKYLTKGNVGVIALTWILFGIGHSLVGPLFSRYIKMLGAGDFEVSLVRMFGLIALTIALIPGGYLTDKLGRRSIIVPFTFIVVLFSFVYAIVPDWKVLLIVWFIDSLFHFYVPALSVIIIDSLPPEVRARGLTFTLIVPNIPWLIFPPIGGYLSELYGINGIRLAYVIDGLIGLLAAFIRFKLLKETLSHERGEPLRPLKVVIDSYRDIVRIITNLPSRIKLLLISRLILLPYPYVFLETYGILFAEEYLNIDRTMYGAFISISTAVSTIIVLITLPFLDMMPRRYLASIPCLLQALAFLYLYIDRSPLSFLMLMIVQYSIMPITASAIQAYIGDKTPLDLRGRIFALFRVVTTLGFSLSNPTIGYLYSILIPGNPYPAVFLCSLTPIITSLYLYYVMR
mgnify:CR=1 FL=1